MQTYIFIPDIWSKLDSVQKFKIKSAFLPSKVLILCISAIQHLKLDDATC